MTLANTYLFKAIENYPYCLEECIEALNYALSYDPENADTLCLMGRIHAEKLKDFDAAKAYYEDALRSNINALNVHPHFINVLIWNEDYNEAKRFIDFALTVKGSDKCTLYLKKAWLSECHKEYTKAFKWVKWAREHAYSNDSICEVDETAKRIKSKLPKTSKKKKKIKKSK